MPGQCTHAVPRIPGFHCAASVRAGRLRPLPSKKKIENIQKVYTFISLSILSHSQSYNESKWAAPAGEESPLFGHCCQKGDQRICSFGGRHGGFSIRPTQIDKLDLDFLHPARNGRRGATGSAIFAWQIDFQTRLSTHKRTLPRSVPLTQGEKLWGYGVWYMKS